MATRAELTQPGQVPAAAPPPPVEQLVPSAASGSGSARATARLQRLQHFTAALSEALTVDDVVQVVLSTSTGLPGVVRSGLGLLSGGGRELRFVALHEDALADDRLPWCRIDAADDLPLAVAARTGRTLEFATLDELAARFPGLAQRQQQFGTQALVTVPLLAHGEILGSVMLAYAEPAPFDATERAFLAALTEQAAHALRRASAYEHQQATAETLQRSLLPDTLPDVPGLSLGARYEPGGLGVDVGGDWFDVLVLDDAAVAFTIGDVMGRGLPAATVMGQVRAALRAYALVDPDPVTVLERLDRFLSTLGAPEQIVTVLYGVVDSGRSNVRLACAGHVPPALAPPAGPAQLLDVAPGPPLGLADGGRRDTVVRLPPEGVLVLCTDGLVESRTRSVDAGLDELLDQLDRLGASHRHPRELAGMLVRAVSDPDAKDDCAVLVLASTVGRQVRTGTATFDSDPLAARSARVFLTGLLDRWGVPEPVRDNAVLCLSEVVTNVVIHTATPARVGVVLDGPRLLVSVADGGRRGSARLLDTDADDVGGRGLALVDALSGAWSAERRADGTTVWFELDLDGDLDERPDAHLGR